MWARLAVAILASDEGTVLACGGLNLDQPGLGPCRRVLEDLMSPTSDEPFARPLTAEEMEQIRRATKDEKRLLSDTWALLRRVAGKLPFAEDVLAAYYCALDPSTDRRVKLTLFAALGYFVMPFDVLPDLLPVIGFTDDAAVIATAIASVANAIRPDHREKAREALQKDV